MRYIVELTVAPFDYAKWEKSYGRRARSPRLPSTTRYLASPASSGVDTKVESQRLTPVRKQAFQFQSPQEVVRVLAECPLLLSFDKTIRRVMVIPA